LPRAASTAACTFCSTGCIGTRQAQSSWISVEPREVTERISRTSGTRRNSASSGRVTARTMSSAGRSPESAMTVMRGNAISGRIAAGNRTPRATPTITSAPSSASKARRWRKCGGEDPVHFALRPRTWSASPC
jgi:hypothetical protein